MSDLFHGKTYRYKRKIIGVCQSSQDNLFMIGYIKPSSKWSCEYLAGKGNVIVLEGKYQKVKDFSAMMADPAALQKELDEFARINNLSEVRS